MREVASSIPGDITSLLQLLSFCATLTSVGPTKDGLVVQSNKNSKASVFFAAFFVYIVNESHREDGENFKFLA